MSFSTFGNDSLVTITLEDGGHTFTVSKALLCSSAEYFKKALDGGFNEAKTHRFSVPGCDEKTFRLFLFHLATKKLPKKECLSSDDDNRAVELARLWVFGEYLMLPTLQNAAMARLLETLGLVTTGLRLIEVAYGNSADGSPLRRAVLGEAVGDCLAKLWPFDREEMDGIAAVPGFFYDFTIHLGTVEEDGGWTPSGSHDHDEYMVAE